MSSHLQFMTISARNETVSYSSNISIPDSQHTSSSSTFKSRQSDDHRQNRPVPPIRESSINNATTTTPKLNRLELTAIGGVEQSVRPPQRRSRSPRVWMESSFVGVKPISSPETPSGDLASFVFDDSWASDCVGAGGGSGGLLNGTNGGGSVGQFGAWNNAAYGTPGNELVPMMKLRSGSVQLDAYGFQGDFLAVSNGETGANNFCYIFYFHYLEGLKLLYRYKDNTSHRIIIAFQLRHHRQILVDFMDYFKLFIVKSLSTT